jgi:hypothetical protein
MRNELRARCLCRAPAGSCVGTPRRPVSAEAAAREQISEGGSSRHERAPPRRRRTSSPRLAEAPAVPRLRPITKSDGPGRPLLRSTWSAGSAPGAGSAATTSKSKRPDYATSPLRAPRPLGAVQTARDGTVVGSRQCEACGAGLRGGQRVACSEKCRAARWRRQQEATREARDRKIRELLKAALRKLEERSGGMLLLFGLVSCFGLALAVGIGALGRSALL